MFTRLGFSTWLVHKKLTLRFIAHILVFGHRLPSIYLASMSHDKYSQALPVFRHSSASVYYNEHKSKKKKKQTGEAWERGYPPTTLLHKFASMLVRPKVITNLSFRLTMYPASSINPLALDFQIAGTVITQSKSDALRFLPWSLNSISSWSLRWWRMCAITSNKQNCLPFKAEIFWFL